MSRASFDTKRQAARAVAGLLLLSSSWHSVNAAGAYSGTGAYYGLGVRVSRLSHVWDVVHADTVTWEVGLFMHAVHC